MAAIQPQTARNFLHNASDIPSIRTLIEWIENDLKRNLDDVVELLVQAEIHQKPPLKKWKEFEVGDKTLYTVTFSDGTSESLCLNKDNTICIDPIEDMSKLPKEAR